MKKYLNTAFIYLIASLSAGVFYREFTKLNDFTAPTVLSVSHVHLFVLGTVLFLIIALFTISTDLDKHKSFKQFYILYNIALPLMIVTFIIKGIVQVLKIDLSYQYTMALAGIAGVTHIMMATALIALFIAFRKTQKR